MSEYQKISPFAFNDVVYSYYNESAPNLTPAEKKQAIKEFGEPDHKFSKIIFKDGIVIAMEDVAFWPNENLLMAGRETLYINKDLFNIAKINEIVLHNVSEIWDGDTCVYRKFDKIQFYGHIPPAMKEWLNNMSFEKMIKVFNPHSPELFTEELHKLDFMLRFGEL